MSSGDKKYYTIKQAAGGLGLKYWQLQRAIKGGRGPSYTLLNSRRWVILEEVIASFRPVSEETL